MSNIICMQSLLEDNIYFRLKEIGSESVDWVNGSIQILEVPSCEHSNESSGFVNDRVIY
jgi:hypothetical protein